MNIKKLLRISCFIGLLCLLFSQSWAASLSAKVDRHRIGENETLTLTVIYDDSGVSGQPNLAGLQSNFQILGSSSSSQTKITNGRIKSTKTWGYNIIPKSTGKLVIPSFELQGAYSEAIEIDVVSDTQNQYSGSNPIEQAQGRDLFIEASVDKTNGYVQEMLTFTLRIYTAVRIAPPKIGEMSLPDFMVEKIGEAQFETRENNRTYYVLQYQYALFPTKSGKFTIQKNRYQISQIISNRPRSMFNVPGFNNTKARFLSTPEITLNIKPAPKNRPATYWLVAEDVTISDNWIDNQTIKQGDSLTRRVEIKSLGSLAANIPPLPEIKQSGLKFYPEPPLLKNNLNNDKLLASRIENTAVVAVETGTYTLPEIKIHWWSTRAKKMSVSILPARTLTISKSVTTNNLSQQVDQQASGKPIPHSTSVNTDTAGSDLIIRPLPHVPFYLNIYMWMITAGLFLLFWIITLVLFIKAKRNSHSNKSPEDEMDGVMKRESLKQSFKSLKKSCENNQAQQTRTALINWAKLKWLGENIQSLQELKSKINQQAFSDLADELDSAIYQQQSSWNGSELLKFLQEGHFIKKIQQETNLPSLYD